MAVIIFKPLEKCNSNCLYCDVIKKHQDIVMSYELLETIFKRINGYLEIYPEEIIKLTWHGGEPCLLGPDYFRKALELLEKHCSTTKYRIEHLIQSNMTVITQELIDLFKEMGIDRIGSSFEPIPHIRGFGKTIDSKAYNRKFFRGVELVEKNGLSWATIYVVHRRSLGHATEILSFMTNMNPRSTPMFNKIYCYSGDEHNLDITPEEYADFLGEMLPIYWNNREMFNRLNPISSFIEMAEGAGHMVCSYSGECAYRWLYIGPTGKVSHCGRAGDYDCIEYGMIQDSSIEEILHDPKRDPIQERQIILPQTECRDCRFWGVCHGGCPLDAFIHYNDFYRKTNNCGFVKCFIERYLEPITGLRIEMVPKQVEKKGLVVSESK
jgi:uncharacterized protein